MKNEDRNPEFSDFINSIIKAAVLKKTAIELADQFSDNFTDDDCLEFTSWFLYRLGSKYGKDVMTIVKTIAGQFPGRYSELLLKGEDVSSSTIGGVDVIFTDGDELTFNTEGGELSDEWDDYDGEDFSDLWDSLD